MSEDLIYSVKYVEALEAVRKAAQKVVDSTYVEKVPYVQVHFDIMDELEAALSPTEEPCEHVWLHTIRPLTNKPNRCTLCGASPTQEVDDE